MGLDKLNTQICASIAHVSQDTLSSLFPIASLSKYYYRHCATSDVYGNQ